MANYAEQIAAFLRSNTMEDAYGRPLTGDPLLGVYDPVNDVYSGIAKGGIYTRPLKAPDPKDNRGATPTAFNPESGSIRPSIFVRLESIVHHPQFQTVPNAAIVNVTIWMYGPSHEGGKIAMEDMRYRIQRLLHGRVYMTDQGMNGHIAWDFTYGVKENHEEFEGSLVDYSRFGITTLLSKED